MELQATIQRLLKGDLRLQGRTFISPWCKRSMLAHRAVHEVDHTGLLQSTARRAHGSWGTGHLPSCA